MQALAFAIALALLAPAASAQVPAAISAAVADSSRPATDTARDANRKPAEVLAFAGVKPGDIVADYASGSGYFTRIFAGVVGPRGHVYATVPSELFTFANIVKGVAETQAWVVGHGNVSVSVAPALQGLRYPQKLDLFWISQNYHDLRDAFMGPVDMRAFNKAVFDALKPGGAYVVLDHVAAPGSPASVSRPSASSSPTLTTRIRPACSTRPSRAAPTSSSINSASRKGVPAGPLGGGARG